MRTSLVAGNWKMNGDRARIARLLDALVPVLADLQGVEVAVCPPYPYIPMAVARLQGTSIAVGAQNLSDRDEGAFTGEVSGPMLADLGCRYVIVGHSERRDLHGESDALVARKFAAARRAGLTPILCVGERLEERDAGRALEVVGRQLEAVLALNPLAELEHAVIAYEPVWAIGTGRTATPGEAQEVHAFVRGRIAARDPGLAARLRILYGGSVTEDNAAGLFAMQDIDGALVGGASLDAARFTAICRAAQPAAAA